MVIGDIDVAVVAADVGADAFGSAYSEDKRCGKNRLNRSKRAAWDPSQWCFYMPK